MDKYAEHDLFDIVWDLEKKPFKIFVDDLRKRVTECSTNVWEDRIPITVNNGETIQWGSMYLKTENSDLLLRIRYEDMYIIGFFAKGQWYIFSEIPDFGLCKDVKVNKLSVSSNYAHLIIAARTEHMQRLTNVHLSFESLKSSIDYLARYPAGDHRIRQRLLAKSMITLAFSTCEPARFHSIYEKVSRFLEPNSEGGCFERNDVLLIRKWGAISRAILQNYYPEALRNSLGICSANDAERSIAIIKPTKEYDSQLKEISGGRGRGHGGSSCGGGHWKGKARKFNFMFSICNILKLYNRS
ncbi:hypothetical protein LUZ63_009445 [Rhynchospora breviuscula]|uniref:rRNA N-glycosylase n=1 Tax=Rhynchospora breviuscula TaxID=2022672 RepID=A0A9Q0CF18_9POAL|nr:hypothetical protein LUZ63_009445 [Rhynchospora breviuscula]